MASGDLNIGLCKKYLNTFIIFDELSNALFSFLATTLEPRQEGFSRPPSGGEKFRPQQGAVPISKFEVYYVIFYAIFFHTYFITHCNITFIIDCFPTL